MTFNYLTLTISLLSFILFVLIFGPNRLDRFYKNFTLLMSSIIFFNSLQIWFNCSWLSVSYPIYSKFLNVVNIQCLFVIDFTSLFFILLTTLLFPFCILASWEMAQVRLLYFNLVLIEVVLVLTFTIFDLFLFCLFFETVLIPMFFIILWWGSRDRRIKALTYFFLYTLLGSVFLFLAIFAVYYEVGSTSFFSIYEWTAGGATFNQGPFILNYISLLLFFVFAVKIPVFPFHIWLPEAHVEAPTVGSVILAGLLLKLGGYGVLRFMYMFFESLEYWQIFILVLLVLSIWLGSILATRQLDLKRIIAYSSIAHMNFALIGVFVNSSFGVVGAYSLFLSHGIVSSALFLLIGFLYDRHHTRLLHYYGGLVQVMPLWVFFFFAFVASNFSFPGTSNFIGELLIFLALGAQELSALLLGVVGFSTFLTVVYSLFMFNRISFGTLKVQYLGAFSDLNRREFFLILPLFLLNFVFGLCPNIFLAPIYYSFLWATDEIEFPVEWLFSTTHPTRVILNAEDEFAVDMVALLYSLDREIIGLRALKRAVENTPFVDWEQEQALFTDSERFSLYYKIDANLVLQANDLARCAFILEVDRAWALLINYYNPPLSLFLDSLNRLEMAISVYSVRDPEFDVEFYINTFTRGPDQLAWAREINALFRGIDFKTYYVPEFEINLGAPFFGVREFDRFGRLTNLSERIIRESPVFDKDFISEILSK